MCVTRKNSLSGHGLNANQPREFGVPLLLEFRNLSRLLKSQTNIIKALEQALFAELVNLYVYVRLCHCWASEFVRLFRYVLCN
jgi:hypothetical protein